MNIPKSIRIYIMYRDGANYKSGEEYVFSNGRKLSSLKITNALKKLIDAEESIVPGYYGITSHPAPIWNEFYPIPANSDDHAFVEIQSFEFDECHTAPKGSDEISVLVDAISKPKLVAARRRKAKEEMIQFLEKTINDLKKSTV